VPSQQRLHNINMFTCCSCPACVDAIALRTAAAPSS
jgi:hypothetical protein